MYLHSVMKKSANLTIVCLWAIICSVVAKPIITSITPWFGSPEGGTELTIRGEGFHPEALFTSMVVYIGGEVCKTIEYHTSNEKIVCITPRCVSPDCLSDQQWQGGEEVSLNIYVADVTGIEDASDAFYYYGNWAPSLTKIGHYTWGQGISWVYGKIMTDLLEDVNIRIGNNFALLGDEDELNTEYFDMWSRSTLLRYKTPADVVAGHYNLTMDVQTDLSRGNRGSGVARTFPDQRPFYYTYDMTHLYNYAATLSGRTYSVGVLPVVASVTPALGSVAGGTVVTLRGSGFPPNADRITVYVAGRPCDVVSSAYTTTTVQCITRPADERQTLVASLLDSSFSTAFMDNDALLGATRSLGSAGWWFKLYDFGTWDWSSTSEYPESEVRLSGGFREGLSFGFEYLFGGRSWPDKLGYDSKQSDLRRFAADFRTVLRAPYSGVYTFSGIVDDRLYVFGRREGEVAETALFSAFFPAEYYSSSEVVSESDGVYLARGELYHLRARTVNTGGPDFTEVSVRIDPAWDAHTGQLMDYVEWTQNGTAMPGAADLADPLPSFPTDLRRLHSVQEVQAIDLDLEYRYEIQVGSVAIVCYCILAFSAKRQFNGVYLHSLKLYRVNYYCGGNGYICMCMSMYVFMYRPLRLREPRVAISSWRCWGS